ncbi:MAG: nucleoside phosphorylase [Deltaproteobacteria bacterium]|nr:nucleoside phosphorylase [Deltaproteobacteria bacterium]
MLSAGHNTSEGLIRPVRRKRDPVIGHCAIMVMVKTHLDDFVRMGDPSLDSPFDMGFFKLYRIEGHQGTAFSVSGPFLGAPQAVMGMEKLVALGASKIWVFGWCGSLQPDLKIGDFVIPISAVSEEGTSQHYPIEGRPPITDSTLSHELESALTARGHCTRPGIVWTTDAPYRETPEKIRAFQQKGILAVDMEISALMTLALFRLARLAALFVVSDELYDLKWQPGFSRPLLKKRTRFAAKLLLDLVGTKRGLISGNVEKG